MAYDPEFYAAMQTGSPYSIYRKTTPSKVVVGILSPFDNKPEILLLFGDPKKDTTARISLWSEMEDVYFKRYNKRHLEMGVVIPFETVKVEVPEKKAIEQFSDEELKDVINSPYAKLAKTVADIRTPAVIMRMLELSREMEKSEKIVNVFEAKLSELQAL
jgi:hypothetical protein